MDASLFTQPAEPRADVGPKADRPATPTLLWAGPEHLHLWSRVAAAAGLEVTHIVQAERQAEQTDLAEEHAFPNARHARDLRHMLLSADVALVVFAAAPAPDLLDDPQLLAEVRARGVRLAAVEPAPVSAAASREFTVGTDRSPVTQLTRFDRGPWFFDALELLEHVGRVRSLHAEMHSPVGAGSASARLIDALAAVHAVLGLPDRVSAALIPPAGGGNPGRNLRACRGALAGLAQWARGPVATFSVSDAHGPWVRRVTILGDAGSLIADDAGLIVRDRAGRTVDTGGVLGAPVEPATLLADAVTRLLTLGDAGQRHSDLAEVLACAEAALLSVRTAGAEEPHTILRLGGGVH